MEKLLQELLKRDKTDCWYITNTEAYALLELESQESAIVYYFLGRMYFAGKVVERNYSKAKEYFEKSFDKRYMPASDFLGYMYQNGFGVEQDYNKALSYYEEAANNGCYSVIYKLAEMCEEGLGVEKNEEKALQFLRYGASHNDCMSQYKLGEYYYLAGPDSIKDVKKAQDYFWQAANNGCASALVYLAIMYQNAVGVERDMNKALYYCQKAADRGLPVAKGLMQNFRFLSGEEIDFKELFNNFEDAMSTNDYFKRIKAQIDRGGKVIRIKSLEDIAKRLNPKIDKMEDNNKKSLTKIQTIMHYLDDLSSDSLLYIDELCDISSLTNQSFSHFYTKHDLYKSLLTITELLKVIDLNQPQEDLFMQILITVAFFLNYSANDFELEFNNITSLNKKLALCGGYSIVLTTILNLVGIEAIAIKSKSEDVQEEHIFVQVKLNGKWYYCDLVWDRDALKKGKTLEYCLKSKEHFANCIYHQPVSEELVHPASEDHHNIADLYKRNMEKLRKNEAWSLNVA